MSQLVTQFETSLFTQKQASWPVISNISNISATAAAHHNWNLLVPVVAFTTVLHSLNPGSVLWLGIQLCCCYECKQLAMIFKAQILDGKGFGSEPQALVCCASFAGAAKTTPYSVAANTHIWNSTLAWSVSREELRSATSNTNHCKISVLRKDGTSLGWVVISLRSAKLQGQYKSDPQGEEATSACLLRTSCSHVPPTRHTTSELMQQMQ